MKIYKYLQLIRLPNVFTAAADSLAGWLLTIRTSGATANLGVGLLFNAFAAVVIGGVSLKGGVGSLPGVYAEAPEICELMERWRLRHSTAPVSPG